MNAAERFLAREKICGSPAARTGTVAEAAARRRRELDRLAGPPPGEIIVRAEGQHFYVLARLNGVPIRMMVDTGATYCGLSTEDARRAGVRASGDTATLSTVTGLVRVPHASIATLAIAGATFCAVPAIIVDRGARGSLLGADVLARFRAVEISADVLKLKV